MTLKQPLFIEKAQIHSIPITPIDTGHTMVLVVDGVCSPEVARLVGVGFIFDDNDVPRDFEGEVGPEGEISGPILSMKLRKGDPLSFDTKKVSKIKLTRDKDDVAIKMRIHLAGTDEKATMANLKSLMKLGKSEFELTVTDRQATMTFDGQGDGPNVPDRVIPVEFFAEKKGKSLRVNIRLSPLQVESVERWYWGFDVVWKGKKAFAPFGQLVDVDGMYFEESRGKAVERAAETIIFSLKSGQDQCDNDQLGLLADCMDWLLNEAPALRKDEKGQRTGQDPVVISIDRKPDPEVEPRDGNSFSPEVEQAPPTKKPGRGPKARPDVM